MSYRLPSRRNWGVLVACVVGVPLGLAWGVVGIVGGALICADQSSDCRGIVWPLIGGLVVIAGGATVVALGVNS